MARKTDGEDGRRNNRPPKAHQIVQGEVRNPDGRRGKSGASTTSIDEVYLREAERVVSRDADRDIIASERLVQEEYFSALAERDPRARARVIKRLADAEAHRRREESKFQDWLFTCKAKYLDLFRQAKLSRTPPPDVTHPSHVDFRNGQLIITGPIDKESRQWWEEMKAVIKFAAYFHEKTRADFRRSPTEENEAALRLIESYRRSLMRKVPRGWNWREEIYCRGSRTGFVKKTICELEALA